MSGFGPSPDRAMALRSAIVRGQPHGSPARAGGTTQDPPSQRCSTARPPRRTIRTVIDSVASITIGSTVSLESTQRAREQPSVGRSDGFPNRAARREVISLSEAPMCQVPVAAVRAAPAHVGLSTPEGSAPDAGTGRRYGEGEGGSGHPDIYDSEARGQGLHSPDRTGFGPAVEDGYVPHTSPLTPAGREPPPGDGPPPLSGQAA